MIEKYAQKLPSIEGIWYYVYYQPNWVREIFRAEEYASIGHIDAWKHYIVPKLIDHYNLEENDARSIVHVPHSMPRGRMSKIIFKFEGEQPGTWMFLYGGDFPSCLNEEREKRMLIYEFSLDKPAAADKVKWKIASHETMNVDDQNFLLDILEIKIPY